jgi:hypothetical protein
MYSLPQSNLLTPKTLKQSNFHIKNQFFNEQIIHNHLHKKDLHICNKILETIRLQQIAHQKKFINLNFYGLYVTLWIIFALFVLNDFEEFERFFCIERYNELFISFKLKKIYSFEKHVSCDMRWNCVLWVLEGVCWFLVKISANFERNLDLFFWDRFLKNWPIVQKIMI